MAFKIDEARLIEFSKRLELTATKVLEGLHTSRRGGEGLEFHSASPYTEGEDIRRIDWKKYASSDRLYVRKFEKEEKSGWTLLIDSSSSMNYGAKLEFASSWAAAMVFLANAWGDSWLILPELQFDQEGAYELLSHNKIGLEPEQFPKHLNEKDSHLLVLSDFFYEEDLLKKQFESWLAGFKQVHLIHILDRREKEFSFTDVMRFEDFEGPEKLTLDAQLARRKYIEEFQAHQHFLKDLVRQEGLYIEAVCGFRPLEEQLLEFFERLWDISA